MGATAIVTNRVAKASGWPPALPPRKAALSVYIMPGYADFSPILARLGPHRIGKSCLTITRLDAVDTGVLAELIRAGLDDLARRWAVEPT